MKEERSAVLWALMLEKDPRALAAKQELKRRGEWRSKKEYREWSKSTQIDQQ